MHRKRKVVKAAAITGLTLVMTTGFALASIGTGTVTADSLRLRSQANTNSATLTFAPRDSVVTLLEELDGWYKVSYDDQVGYMSADWLKVSQSSSEIVMGLGTVTADTLDIRSGAGLVYNSLGVLYKDASVIILEDCGNGWYKVSGAGCIGYVSAECVEVANNRGSAIDTEPVGTGTVNVTCMDVRFGPGNGYSSIGYLYSKEPVSILKDCGNGWYQIAYGSGSAYVRADYITRDDLEADQEDADTSETASEAEAASQDTAGDDAKSEEATNSQNTESSISEASFTAYVTEALNVRSGAGTDYSRLGVLYAGNTVTVLGDAVDGWYKISYEDGVGYVSTEYISHTLDFANSVTSTSSSSSESSSNNNTSSNTGSGSNSSSNSNAGSSSNNNSNSNAGSAPASSVGAQAVELAKAQLGKPYVYGAAGPNGFDCSGLFYYIFNQLGVPIARGSSNQYYSSGTFVSVDEMQPGDLVYLFDPRFDSSGGTLPTTHVMMYIGDNTVIHASTTSYTVQCDTLFGGYYGNYVVAVKRMG